MAAVCSLVLVAAGALPVHAQDTRTVTEPTLPDPDAICSLQTAQISSVHGDLGPDAESHFDTDRIQAALDGCWYGGAVELQPASGYDAFQIQPIAIPAGVTLLIDPGATMYASRNPRDYDNRADPPSCGIIAASSPGCKPLITIRGADDTAIMGGGAINGRGGDTLLGQDVTWWELARLAQQQQLNQFNPRMIQITSSNNVILYQISLINAPNVHVAASGGDGLTVWAVRVDTPDGARNTDGIDPGNMTNVTITESSISDGDDNVAIGAGSAPASQMTVSYDHFGTGHGVSIGSYTRNGVSNVSVSNLNIRGLAGDRNDTGLRIKSNSSRGGLVQGVSYRNVCMQDVSNPLQFDPFYSGAGDGSQIPTYQNIELHNVHALTRGKVKLQGFDDGHALGISLDNVIIDSIAPADVTASQANVTLGPAPVNIPIPLGDGVSIDDEISTGDPPYDCSSVFPGAGALVTVGGPDGFDTVQDAVDALPSGGGTIEIAPGTYVEVVHIDKPNVRLVGLGSSPEDVVITYNNSAGTPDGHGGTLGTSGSGTLYARGDGFFAEKLTIQNTFDIEHEPDLPPDAQAVALYLSADRAVLRNVRIIGRQDTLYARSKGCSSSTCVAARQYFYGSYIEGNVDFIFGDAAAVFDRCTIMVMPHGDLSGTTTITAQGKSFANYLSGYVFINSVVRSDAAMTKVFLGRPWRQYATDVWLDTFLQAPVRLEGWLEWDGRLSGAYYAEYRSFGPGAIGPREPYAVPLCAIDAQQWEPDAFLSGSDDWRPTLIY